jgi:hypothetical protein
MLTTVTYWPMVDSQGRPTVDVNSPPAVLLETGLSEQTVRFVDLYRKDGNSEIRYPTDLLEMKHTLTRDCHDAKGALVPLGTEIKTDIGQTELELICDRLSDGRGGSHSFRQGLVNVNTAPMEVLACLPRINEASARAIADMRGSLSSEAKSTIAWLYTRGVVDAETFRYIAPKITARSYQYRVQCIGFGVPCGRIRVIETIVDTARRRPKIIYLRDITRLGVPFALDVEVKETPRT